MSASRIYQPRVRARARTSFFRSASAKFRRYLSPCIRLSDKSSLAVGGGHRSRTFLDLLLLFSCSSPRDFPSTSTKENRSACAHAPSASSRDPHARIALFSPPARPDPLVHHPWPATHFQSCPVPPAQERNRVTGYRYLYTDAPLSRGFHARAQTADSLIRPESIGTNEEFPSFQVRRA